MIKLPVPQSCGVHGSGFLRAAFFLFDSLLAVWHNIYLARLLLLMSKHNQQKNPVQKKMAGIDPTQSKHSRLHFLLCFWRWDLCRCVWLSPFGSALSFFCAFSSYSHIHCFLYYFFFQYLKMI